MLMTELIDSIRVDLGCDVVSLGISEASIELKIKEALMKVSVYAPYVSVETFDIVDKKVYMPDDTTCVVEVMNLEQPSATGARVIADDQDLFSVSRYLYNYNDLMDPYIFLMQKNAISTLQSFVSLTDYHYDKQTRQLFLSNFTGSRVCVKYLRRYRSVEEIEDLDVLQRVKEYALALCKIIEGNIRRKLQNAPGAISMDGDALVSEGMSEKSEIESRLPEEFQYLRFGVRA